MKTELQVHAFLKLVRGKEEKDELAIVQYCAQNLTIKVKFPTTDDDTLIPVTFEQFKEWLILEAPNSGDTVVYEEGITPSKTVAIVKAVTLDNVVAGVSLTSNNGIITHDTQLPRTGYRDPETPERLDLIHAISNAGFEWSDRYNRLVEKFVPIIGNYVRFTHSSGESGIGVFKGQKNGNVVMFCSQVGNNPVEHSLKDDVGKLEDLQFELMSNADKKELAEALAKVGKTWNAYLKRVEPLNMQVGKGEEYFTINDKWHVITIHESLSHNDKKRYWSGNYFRNHKDASDAVVLINKMLKEQLARPNLNNDDND